VGGVWGGGLIRAWDLFCVWGGRAVAQKDGAGGATRAGGMAVAALGALRGLGGSAHGLVVADGLGLGIFFL
jgi:hypothetical protein